MGNLRGHPFMMSTQRMWVGFRHSWRKGQNCGRMRIRKREGEESWKRPVWTSTHQKIMQIYIFELLQALKLAPNPTQRSLMKARKAHHSNGVGIQKARTEEERRFFKVFNFVWKDQDNGDKINQVLSFIYQHIKYTTKLSTLFFVRKSRVLCR